MNRRQHLKSIAAGTLAVATLPSTARADGGLTPAQTEGPFYPVVPIPLQADLTRRAGAAARGRPLIFHGIVSRAGVPLAGATVEIWQADVDGRYRHPRDGGESIDPGFAGFGAQATDAQGRYRFVTIVPVPYQGRPPHIHLRVRSGDRVLLTTQAYPADIGQGPVALDRIARQGGHTERLRFVLAGEAGTPEGRFDIVLA